MLHQRPSTSTATSIASSLSPLHTLMRRKSLMTDLTNARASFNSESSAPLPPSSFYYSVAQRRDGRRNDRRDLTRDKSLRAWNEEKTAEEWLLDPRCKMARPLFNNTFLLDQRIKAGWTPEK